MSRYFLRFSLALIVVLPCAVAAQMNAPLTGGAAAQPMTPAAVAAPVRGASQAATQAPQGSQVAPQAAMPDRAVVRQVQTPMPAASAPAATSTSATAGTDHHEAMGDVTRGLLAAQADGRRAGGALPMLGPVSTASWNRYLDSFRQPIPQWFTEKVRTDSK